MVTALQMEDGSWIAFMCDRPPFRLLETINRNRVKFCEAAGRLQPEAILWDIPATFPAINVLDWAMRPCNGYFDVERAMGGGRRPYLSTMSWIILCRKIAAQDLWYLESSVDLCNEYATCSFWNREIK